MNLIKLFETQKKLDDRIVEEKGLEGRDLLPEKILALLTELGELSNEWRGFKFWSEDREPKGLLYHYTNTGGLKTTKTTVPIGDEENGIFERDITEPMTTSNPLLEEYVDNIHFILSIGNDYEITEIDPAEMEAYFKTVDEPKDLTEQFNSLFAIIAMYLNKKAHYKQTFYELVRLGKMLGFTWEEIESAYYTKNKINHSRQENNY